MQIPYPDCRVPQNALLGGSYIRLVSLSRPAVTPTDLAPYLLSLDPSQAASLPPPGHLKGKTHLVTDAKWISNLSSLRKRVNRQFNINFGAHS